MMPQQIGANRPAIPTPVPEQRPEPPAHAGSESRPPSPSPSPKATLGSAYDPRSNNFDVIRFGLASVVIWSHCFPLSGRAMDPVYAMSRQIDGGSLAVDGFFIVSGFLITQSWMSSPEVRGFTLKRSLRILPALILAVIFGAFVVGPMGYEGSPISYYASPAPWMHFAGVILHRYLYIPGTFEGNPIPTLINSPLWSLRYEIFCYAVVALIGFASPRRMLVPSVALLFLVSWYAAGASNSPDTILLMSARLFACFSAGMLLFLLRQRVPFDRVSVGLAFTALATCFLIGGFRWVLPIAGGYLLLAIAATRAIPLQRFGRFGDFSYGLYVFAYPIQQSLVRFFGAETSVLALFAATMVLTLPVAALSWHFVEAPAIAMKRRVTRVPIGATP